MWSQIDEDDSYDRASSAVVTVDETLTIEGRVGYPAFLPRTLHFRLLLPDADGPHPLVLVSHGSAPGTDDPDEGLVEWADFLAARGYAVALLAHSPRGELTRHRLCQSLGIPSSGRLALGGECLEYKFLDYDRPRDVSAVLDFLEAEADPDIDLDRILHLGHSAGAGAASMLAGVPRSPAPGLPVDRHPDERIDAFVALSPQGADDAGFGPDAFGELDRPVLFITGSGDATRVQGEDYAQVRRTSYDTAPTGIGMAQLWLEHEGIGHGFYGNPLSGKCAATAPCVGARHALQSTVLAWADLHLDVAPIDADDWLVNGWPAGHLGVEREWSQK